MWDAENGAFYFFNAKAQISTWEEPSVPYRPMVRDRFTQLLVPAWPSLDLDKPLADRQPEPGMCMVCKVDEATRFCNSCDQPRFEGKHPKWGDGKFHFCFKCFASHHNVSAAFRKHEFTITKKFDAAPLRCCVCAELATRRCHGSAGTHCDANFCAGCWKTTHRRGKRAQHVWTGFVAAAPVCVMCEAQVAVQHCVQCNDDLCKSCSDDTHSKGKKTRHTFKKIIEKYDPEDGEELCSFCGTRKATKDDEWGNNATRCRECKAALCDSCAAFNHEDVCEKLVNAFGDRTTLITHPTKCIVCGRGPKEKDGTKNSFTRCIQCGDVYCTNKWMGNPGCFAKHHAKGHLREHVQEPYTYMDELEAHEAELERLRAEKKKKEEEDAKERIRLREARERALLEDQNERDVRLALSAQEELKRRKKKASGGFIERVIQSIRGPNKERQ
jgi:hypothetical protein